MTPVLVDAALFDLLRVVSVLEKYKDRIFGFAITPVNKSYPNGTYLACVEVSSSFYMPEEDATAEVIAEFAAVGFTSQESEWEANSIFFKRRVES